ncbi:MAG TPA: PRC-barrel domain-containing protein [Dissulfurispiraceae bacterium]
MRKRSIFALVFVLSMLLAFGVFAAGKDQSSSQSSDQSTRGGGAASSSSQSGTYSRTAEGKMPIERASKIIGMNVKNPQGETLGDVKDIAIDDKTGRIAYAVLAPSSSVGAGSKYFAIPWKALTFSTTGDNLILNASKDKLKNAPGFNKDNWPDFANQQWGSEVHRYYGQQPYWEGQSGASSSSQGGSSQ